MPRTRRRVALYAQCGIGNLGNEGTLATVIDFLRTSHPEVELVCVCERPDIVTCDHGVKAVSMSWRPQAALEALPPPLRLAITKMVDLVRSLAMGRHFDAVIVPGMGVMEQLGSGPWGLPFGMFRTALAARLWRRDFALIAVGAEPNERALSRLFMRATMTLATYLSFRDEYSRRSAGQLGAKTQTAAVYADLVFASAVPPTRKVDAASVAVGVMSYFGIQDDPDRQQRLHEGYVEAVCAFVEWLLDHGFSVHVVTGAAHDEATAEGVVRTVRSRRPDLANAALAARPSDTLDQLMDHLADVALVVATRYHNIVSSLMLGKPTISVSYGPKNDVLMDQTGLGAYCQPIEELDVDLLIKQFQELALEAPSLGSCITGHTTVLGQQARQQLDELSRFLRQMG